MTALVHYTLRACLPARRLAGLGLLMVAGLLFGLIAAVVPEPATSAFGHVAEHGLFGLVLPLAGLVVGDAVLGAEVRKGTFHFTWLSPVPRWQIAVGRWVGGSLVVIAAMAPTFFLAGVIAGTPRGGAAAAAGAALGGAAYVAVLMAVGATFRRAAAVSLALVFLGERLLGGVLTGIAQWSPQWEGSAVFTGWAHGLVPRDGIPNGWGAVVRLVLITLIGLALTSWRLGKLELAGPGD
ncbi:MAG: type transport system permease protein [Actinomycetota bacterium]|jgi:ABC-type transport system involved in multi-copper enzyme maturation permease subunit